MPAFPHRINIAIDAYIADVQRGRDRRKNVADIVAEAAEDCADRSVFVRVDLLEVGGGQHGRTKCLADYPANVRAARKDELLPDAVQGDDDCGGRVVRRGYGVVGRHQKYEVYWR